MDPLADLGNLNNVVAIPLQVVGFGVAFWQIRKVQTAAAAARNATRSTEIAVARNRVLNLIP